MKRFYLDHNGATFPYPEAIEAYQYALKEVWANSASIHREGQAAKSLLAESRMRIASCFDVDPSRITFFSTATEALYTFIKGMLMKSPSHEIVTSDLEHAAVYDLCKKVEKDQESKIAWISPRETGAVSSSQIESIISEKTSGIALISVNNETGVIADLETIAHTAEKHRIPLLVDAVAHFGKEPFTLYKGISAACFSSSKIHGPSGVGFSVMNENTSCPALFIGGGQEFGRRAGTVNVPGIYACSIAVKKTDEALRQSMEKMRMLRDSFEKYVLEKIPDVKINGTGRRVCNTSNLAFPGIDGETLLIQLDQMGVSASHASACSAGAMEPSRVLKNMGYAVDRVRASVRFSFDASLSMEEVLQAAQIVVDAAKYQKNKLFA